MGDPSPIDVLLNIAGCYALPRCLHVVADLGVSDALGEIPLSAMDLADAVGADSDALGRVLRLLSAYDVFAIRDGLVSHTETSRLIRADHPQSMRAFVRMFGFPIFWVAQGNLDDSVRSGGIAAEALRAGGYFAYLERNPEAGTIFNAAMAAKARGHVAGILAAYDFTRFGTVCDVGGGRGHLLRAIVNAAPAVHGTLFDLPHVVGGTTEFASDRFAVQSGDFFRDRLPVCDAYILMEVIHDWNEPDAQAILRAVRAASPPNATLLVIEQMIPADDAPHWSKTLDIHMLALLGGRQRSRQEYEELMKLAAFAFKREIDTGVGISLLEATAA